MINIQNEWPTQSQDMEMAIDIIDKYLALNEGEPLGFLEIVIYRDDQDREKIQLRTPDWLKELSFFFRDQYGYEHGQAITSKVLTKLLLKNEIVH